MKLSGAAGRALHDELRAQLANGLEQTLQIVWLAKNGEAFANGFLRLLAVSGGEKNRNMGMVAPYEPGKLEASHAAGHEKIGEDQVVRGAALELLQCVRSVQGDFDGIAKLLEVAGRYAGNFLVVFHEQDRSLLALDLVREDRMLSLYRLLGRRQIDADRSTAAELALDDRCPTRL